MSESTVLTFVCTYFWTCTHVLTSHVGKMLELRLFGAGNVAISDAHKERTRKNKEPKLTIKLL